MLLKRIAPLFTVGKPVITPATPVEIMPDNQLRLNDDTPLPQKMSLDDLLKEAQQQYHDAYFGTDENAFCTAAEMMDELEQLRLGATSEINAVNMPPSSPKLAAAAQSVIDNFKMLQDDASAAVEGISCQDLQDKLAQLLNIQKHKKRVELEQENLAALESNLAQQVFQPLTQIHGIIKPLLKKNRRIGGKLELLDLLIVGSAKAGAVRREDNIKVAEDAVAEAEQDKAAAAAPPAPPSPTPPTPTPPAPVVAPAAVASPKVKKKATKKKGRT